MNNHSVEDWYSVITHALEDQEVKAIPGLLILMAQDGYGHEVEELRRRMVSNLNQRFSA